MKDLDEKMKRIRLFIQNDGIEALKTIIKGSEGFYIDGTLHNASSGMNWSCAGIKDDCLMIFLEKPEDVKLEDFVKYDEISMGSDEKLLLNNEEYVYVHKEVLEQIEEDEYLQQMQIVVSDSNADPPIIYLQLS